MMEKNKNNKKIINKTNLKKKIIQKKNKNIFYKIFKILNKFCERFEKRLQKEFFLFKKKMKLKNEKYENKKTTRKVEQKTKIEKNMTKSHPTYEHEQLCCRIDHNPYES